MKHLIIGHGEVGSGLHKVIGKSLVWDLEGPATWDGESHVDVIHICIPYSDKFDEIVEMYKEYAELIIVHSSVPVGTCDRLKVVHSPIKGVHPHLAKGIKTFAKPFGGKNAQKAANIFKKLGVKTRAYKDARTTEALKLWETSQYGRLIMLEKEVYEWCKKNKVDFDAVYTQANKDYNEGYMKLGRPEVVRPYLKHVDGPIGGHCVLPNAKLLGIKL
jgi:UDP-N-acetyl-D-mannosaminuronate dehydrogenase